MTHATRPIDGATGFRVEIQLRPAVDLTDAEFFELCRLNRDVRLERTPEGAIVIMPPAGGATGHRNLVLGAALYAWSRADGTGTAFDSSTGFVLPDGATRSPDAAWVQRERLVAIPPAAFERFLPLCPDFVAELASPSDRLADLEAKLEAYIANGARLGWLIDPVTQSVLVYRPGRRAERLERAATIAGDPELPGFVLDLTELWRTGP